MSILGSSTVPVFAFVNPATNGLRGDTGPTGPIGITGISVIGNTGPTGIGVVSVSYLNKGITFHLNSGTNVYLQFPGITGVSFINSVPQSVIVARGLTSGSTSLAGYSVLYSFVNSFENSNSVVIQPQFSNIDQITDEIYLKLRTIEAGGRSLVGLSGDSSYIYLVGKTYDNNPLGNTGEILYFVDGLVYAIDGSYYNDSANLLSVALSSERLAIHDNQNIASAPTYTFSNQNISGLSGATGFGFFNVNYGTFSFFNGNYVLATDVPTINTTLNIGRTGSDTLTFKFMQVTYPTGLTKAQFIPQEVNSETIGSCCFCQASTTEISCLDYVNRSYCTSIGGSFNTTSCVQRISSGDCYAEGACCVNGTCVNSSQDKCLKFNGVFYPGELCSGGSPDSSYFICPNTCPTTPATGKCCYKGYCFDLTGAECESIPGAVFTPGLACESRTTDSACCVGYIGACCTKEVNDYICEQKTARDCSTAGGIFHGIGTNCAEVECCGFNFIQDYFNASTSCKVESVLPCLPLGTKVGGGYLAGIVGMPSPCSTYSNPNVAYGQPLVCRVLPRGQVNGSGGFFWNWKNCDGANNVNLGLSGARANDVNIEYFIRTKSSPNIDLTYTDNGVSKCLVKYGTPYIQQTYRDITTIQGLTYEVKWTDQIQYEGSETYNASNGKFAYPIGSDINVNYILSEKASNDTASSRIYRELASEYYGENSVHMLWALIVAPDDAYNGDDLKWGMPEGRARLNVNGTSSYNTDPITSLAVDGLLSTRLFDASSKNKPRLWFRGQTNKDDKAYDRFVFYQSIPGNGISKLWSNSVNENLIETNIDAFQAAYSVMWENSNPENSCTRQISVLNENEYNGYSDWYIPSIVELNYIHNNIQDINNQILLNGDTPIKQGQNVTYWSSSSVCHLKSWSQNDHLDYKLYAIEESPSSIPYNTKLRFYGPNPPSGKTPDTVIGLSDKQLYELSLNTCAGERMLTQKFIASNLSQDNDGLMVTKHRLNESSKLRPVRRIPIIIGCANDINIEEFVQNAGYFGSCESCPGNCTPEI